MKTVIYNEEVAARMAAQERQRQKDFLDSMQGPERHLVGDVAERIPQPDDVEEVKPGRRDVGEIGGAVDLRGYIEKEINEARRRKQRLGGNSSDSRVSQINGQIYALAKIQMHIANTACQRSDLSNDERIHGDKDA